jgi:hypothetical protein
MPLHDWSELQGWDGVHQVWIVELLYWVKPRLPQGYRAYIGTTPTFAIGAPGHRRPDVGVTNWPLPESIQATPSIPSAVPGDLLEEPDEEIAVGNLAGDPALLVEREGRLVAAVELVSPRNKDRGSACAAYTSAYSGFLLRGVHLLLVDVHRRPLSFSFADRIAEELQLVEQPACPTPFAVAYRVGEPAPSGGRFLALWRRPLVVGSPLPPMGLPLALPEFVQVDLEETYRRATEAAYMG